MTTNNAFISSILFNLLPRLCARNSSFTLRNKNILCSKPLIALIQPKDLLPVRVSFTIFPNWIESLWESVLRAVPKKKTSHSKKRSRQRAGKALKDVTALNKCSGCGHVKRIHVLCPYCVKDIFSLAVTPKQILSASGASAIKIHTRDSLDEASLTQTLTGAHSIGCHHIATSRDGKFAVSVGFGGEAKVWKITDSEEWVEEGSIVDGNKAGEIWAISMNEDGEYLASTSYDGRINLWNLKNGRKKIREFETNGSFGMCIDMSCDGRLTASGHENGAIYVFNNETGKMVYSLPGLVKPVRSVAFSPASTRLAAAGDACVIALYDIKFGEQVANLTGHSTWIFSLDWSHTGEYLLSGSSDGKVKIWSISTQTCVTTHGNSGKTLWSVKWIPKTGGVGGVGERFVTAGAGQDICLYREATGA